jgi:hypothetical protein
MSRFLPQGARPPRECRAGRGPAGHEDCLGRADGRMLSSQVVFERGLKGRLGMLGTRFTIGFGLSTILGTLLLAAGCTSSTATADGSAGGHGGGGTGAGGAGAGGSGGAAGGSVGTSGGGGTSGVTGAGGGGSGGRGGAAGSTGAGGAAGSVASGGRGGAAGGGGTGGGGAAGGSVTCSADSTTVTCASDELCVLPVCPDAPACTSVPDGGCPSGTTYYSGNCSAIGSGPGCRLPQQCPPHCVARPASCGASPACSCLPQDVCGGARCYSVTGGQVQCSNN